MTNQPAPQITTRDRSTSNGSTRAGQMPVVRNLTEILVDGEVVDTIIWSRPLVARLAKKGETREEYVARMAALFAKEAS